MTNHIVIRGDSLQVLPTLEAESFDAIVTDPPYGLSVEPDIAEVMACWIAGKPYKHGRAGFMSKDWDASVPGPEYWREVFRVLKPGGHLLAMSSSRTWDLLSIAIRFAGFESRDTIAVHGSVVVPIGVPALHWTFGSGFPKSLNVSKAIDKQAGAEREVVGLSQYAARANTHPRAMSPGDLHREVEDTRTETAPATDAAKKWDGWGTALKPSHEVILVFRRPLRESTVAAQVLATGTGAINVDACRVGTPDDLTGNHGQHALGRMNDDGWKPPLMVSPGNPAGRWPPNTLLCHLPSCKQVGTNTVKAKQLTAGRRTVKWGVEEGGCTYEKGTGAVFATEDGKDEVPAFECAEGCPIAEMDRQSNQAQLGRAAYSFGTGRAAYSFGTGGRANPSEVKKPGMFKGVGGGGEVYGDSGGASRFFPNFTWEPGEIEHAFRYVAKTSKGERNAGMPEGAANKHVTVKPLNLMRFLVKLVPQPGGKVLDPFCGSGTTGMACVHEGFEFTGIELEEESANTARLRIAGVKPPVEEAPEEDSILGMFGATND